MKQVIRRIFIYLLFIPLWMSSCNEEGECPGNSIPQLTATFINSNNTIISPDTLNIVLPLLSDTLIAGRQVPVELNIPLDLNSDTTYLLIETGKLWKSGLLFKRDTLAFIYKLNLVLNDLECDFTSEFTLTKVLHTNNEIDSVAIKWPEINQESGKHVEIYY